MEGFNRIVLTRYNPRHDGKIESCYAIADLQTHDFSSVAATVERQALTFLPSV
jgi:hypothetical protein